MNYTGLISKDVLKIYQEIVFIRFLKVLKVNYDYEKKFELVS